MSVRPLMYLKPLALFEDPLRRGLHFDGGPSENLSPRADLFSGGVGEKKNVTEWVKNGETTAEAKALANSLQAQMEAIKRETDLQLVQEYRFVFDQYILDAESYDSPETLVNDRFKNKGALYVLEQSCPVLKAQFKAYPDLRYLAYASATKAVPDVDVLPMNSTVSMVDGTVYLKRPGKADAEFKLFPWDYRTEIEKKYQELKPAPKQEAVAEVAQADAVAQAPEPTPTPSQMVAPEEATPVRTYTDPEPKQTTETEVTPKDTNAYEAYRIAKEAGDAETALHHLEEAQKLGSTDPNLQEELDVLRSQFGRVKLRGDANNCSWRYSPLSTLRSDEYKPFMDFALKALQDTGEFNGLLPLGEYTLVKPRVKVSPTFRVKDKMPTQVNW